MEVNKSKMWKYVASVVLMAFCCVSIMPVGTIKVANAGELNAVKTNYDGKKITVSEEGIANLHLWLGQGAKDATLNDVKIRFEGAKEEYKGYIQLGQDTVNLANDDVVTVGISLSEAGKNADIPNETIGQVVITSGEDKKQIGISYVKEKVNVSEISFSSKNINLPVDKPYMLVPIYGPIDATNMNVKWEVESGDFNIIKTAENMSMAVLKPNQTGESVIKVSTVGAGESKEASITVKVYDGNIGFEPDAGEPAGNITANGIGLDVKGFVKPFKLTVNQTDEIIEWSSSKATVATVDKDGIVTIKGVGETDITAKEKTTDIERKITINVEEVAAMGIAIYAPNGTDVSGDSLNVGEGISIQLKASVVPENATNGEFTWASSDQSIFTVSDKGLLKGISKGTADALAQGTLKVSTKNADDGVIEQEVYINVYEKKLMNVISIYKLGEEGYELRKDATGEFKPVKPGTDDELDKVKHSFAFGEGENGVPTDPKDIVWVEPNETIELLVVPKFNELYLFDNKIKWAASESGIVSISDKVNNDGTVVVKLKGSSSTAKAGKTIRIVATNTDGYAEVYLQMAPIVPKSITITNVPSILEVGKQSKALKVKVEESNAHKDVNWSIIEGNGFATIDEKTGIITATGEGKIKVQAESALDKTIKDTVEVVIGVPLKNATLDTTTLILPPGGSHRIAVSVTPYNATAAKTYTYSSREPYIARVKDGVIEVDKGAVKGEYTYIDVIVGNNEKKLSYKVTVGEELQLSSVSASSTDIKLAAGASKKLSYKLNPSKTTERSVNWESNNPELVHVDAGGTITAVGGGNGDKATITGSFSNGLKIEYNVTVTPVAFINLKGLEATKYNIELNEKESIEFNVFIKPNLDSDFVLTKARDKYKYLDVTEPDANGDVTITVKDGIFDNSKKTSVSETITLKDTKSKKSASIIVKIKK